MRQVVIGFVLAIAALASAAQTLDKNEARCGSPDPDIAIDGCTATIQARDESTAHKAVAFYNRANAYRNKGFNDKSLADYTKAIALDAKYAHAYYNRASLHLDAARYEEAIADYSK